MTGAAHYTTVKGPDGKEYAIAGEVPIRVKKGKTPQETIRLMQQVKAAALAPADPSPQDLKVAQTADMIASKAKMQLHQQNDDTKNSQSDKNNTHIDIYA